MMKTLHKSFAQSFLFWMLAIILIYCLILSGCESAENQETTRDNSYSVDSLTLIDDINHGKENVFTLLPPASVFPGKSDLSVTWAQKDYFSIARIFHYFTTDESLDGLSLREMHFNLLCKKVDFGPQGARFEYFKTVNIKGKNTRLVRDIFISADEDSMRLMETIYSPVLYYWSRIDLSKIKISVTDALKIAERTAGVKYRKEVQNNCIINITMSADNLNSGWLFEYTDLKEVPSKTLRLNINAQTGESNQVQ